MSYAYKGARGEALSAETCAPYESCRQCILCQRCGLCIAHCTCPPPEMRKGKPKVKRQAKGARA